MPEPGKKVANSLVAMSSAAILAVYSAGYTRTRAAARRLEAQAAARVPSPVEMVKPVAPPPAPVAAVPSKATHARASAAVPAKVKPAAPAPIDLPEPPPATPPIAETLPAGPAPIAAPESPPPPPAPKWKDGTYLGWGSSRHGDIQAAVTIESGRITSATIAQCLTRYSCSVIANLPPEVPQRQSADVDYVSGATQSANAFYYAVVDALGKAK
jgi:uncharacterized protein with FMN-binding domain